MKATGIVRRIDELGRIVIPKEIRRILGIREADPLEIYTGDNGSIILRKYQLQGCCIFCKKEAGIELHELPVCCDCAQRLAQAAQKKCAVQNGNSTTA